MADNTHAAAPWFHGASLNAQNSGTQLRIAVALIAVVPVLSVAFIAVFDFTGLKYSLAIQASISGLGLLLAGVGYVILRRYPRNLDHLRHHLADIAAGTLPEKVDLPETTRDVNAIEGYLNRILDGLREQIDQLEDQLRISREQQDTIEQQAAELVDAERHRVMVESLGAACHHIGQPATVLQLYVTMLQKELTDPEQRQKLDACMEQLTALAGILDRLRQVSTYRTVPYRTYGNLDEQRRDNRIVDITETIDESV